MPDVIDQMGSVCSKCGNLIRDHARYYGCPPPPKKETANA